MTSAPVNVSVTEGVAEVRLARPRARNAWDEALGDGMAEAFSDLATRSDVRCVLLTGDGPVFCAGADLVTGFPTLSSGHDDLRSTLRRRFHPAFLALLDVPQPVVAAVHGPAIGAGACLALGADIAVLARETYLQFRFAGIGLMPDVGATALLATLVGPAKAAELLMLGERIEAEECLRLGLVSRLADTDATVDGARALVQRLAAGPTRAHAMTKTALRAWSWRGIADQLETEAGLQQTLGGTDDWAEGRTAFIERREPRFTGR